ncbi:hypothetical protein [Eubacterium maltosivorans]|uniref:hypothetical protein n=1 Tax=Eubacterium maltosivorans TaxID=2041044 RepID=UPI003A92D784
MKIAKIIIGVVCILLSFVIAYQSAVAGVTGIMTSISSTLESAFGGSNVPQEMDMSFFGGFFVAVSYYASGITSIAACGKRGGSIACLILMFVACLVGIGSMAFGTGAFTNLIIVSLGAFALSVFYIVDATKDLKKK